MTDEITMSADALALLQALAAAVTPHSKDTGRRYAIVRADNFENVDDAVAELRDEHDQHVTISAGEFNRYVQLRIGKEAEVAA